MVRALGGNPSERQIYDANPGRMKMFFNVEEGPADDRSYPKVSLESEHLQYHPPGSKLLSQDLPKNVDGMAALYFDQPPHLMKLGTRGDLDYRHSLAYPNIVAILEAETKLAARDGKPTEVRLDLKALGLDHDRLRPYLTFADGQPRTYVDISDPAHPRTLRTDQPAPPPPAVAPSVGPGTPPGTPPGISPSAPSTPANAPATTGIPVAPAESPPSAPSPPQTVPSAPGMPTAVPASLTGTPAALADSPADRTTAPVLPVPALGAKDRAVFEDVAEIARMRGIGEAGGRNAAMAMVASLHEPPLSALGGQARCDGRTGRNGHGVRLVSSLRRSRANPPLPHRFGARRAGTIERQPQTYGASRRPRARARSGSNSGAGTGRTFHRARESRCPCALKVAALKAGMSVAAQHHMVQNVK